MQEDTAREIQFHPEGRGGIDNFRLVSVSNKTEFGPVTLPFLLDANQQIDFGPVAMGNGHTTPTLRGSINRIGYRVNMTGEADIARALRLARTIGIPVLATTAEGTAQIDLQIASLWAGQTLANSTNAAGSGFAGPLVTGTARLRNVQVTPRGVNGSLEISSAELRLLPDKVYVAKINAKAAGTSWTGPGDAARLRNCVPGPLHAEWQPDRAQSACRMGGSGNEEAAVVPRLEYGYSSRPGRARKHSRHRPCNG